MDCFKRRKNKKSNIGALRRESETDIHTIDLRELLSNLGTSISTGLRTQQAKEIFQEQGPNSLTSSTKTHELIRIIHCCFGGFAILIWVFSCSFQLNHEIKNPLQNSFIQNQITQ